MRGGDQEPLFLADIPQIPGLLSVIFRLIEARRNEIRSPLPLFEAKSPGCPPRSAGTRCFAFIKAHLCRRRRPHLTPICRSCLLRGKQDENTYCLTGECSRDVKRCLTKRAPVASLIPPAELQLLF
jgi:hypothetical protein